MAILPDFSFLRFSFSIFLRFDLLSLRFQIIKVGLESLNGCVRKFKIQRFEEYLNI